jgi:redox-sensitive bicupin YhaK (pirin superfamily)
MSAKVIAGTFGNARGPVTGIAIDPLYVDLRLGPGITQDVPISPGHAAIAYVFDGATTCGGASVPKGTLAVLGDGGRVRVTAGKEGAALLLIAGRPLGEPIARYGPFVMNTRDEIAQAFADFQAGRL